SIFLFKNGEPITSWMAIISGPLSTLPADFLSAFKPKLGGYWLIAGSLVSCASVALGSFGNPDWRKDVLGAFCFFTAPMLLLGTGTLLVARSKGSRGGLRNVGS